ncbi:MAG TPA: NUDIX hydrolase [Synergistales bacterium]|nr:NUDIX hydrolase [Synergistaceae bacterium]HQO82398.1 NUDIX hydrolase [Synergistales bacterium]HQQ10953.1 NUDIX hydrolase [Synergistales bacterium]
MPQGEEKISGNLIYRGRILNLRVDSVKLPDGGRAMREVVEHAPAVGVVSEAENGDLFLVRQFRYPAGEFLLEIPAGIVEPGEKAAETAARELQEEIGFIPGELNEVTRFYTSPGFTNELIILFHARDLAHSPRECDGDEFMDVVRLSRDQLKDLAESGEIRDSKTLTAIYWYLSR